MNNVQDLSSSSGTSAGFQFEFRCEQCGSAWRSPFTPYRTGQLSGVVALLSRMVGINAKVGNAAHGLANMRSTAAHEKALAAATALAAQRFHVCENCRKAVDAACWNDASRQCNACAEPAGASDQGSAGSAERAGGFACPNCQSATDGGRFCAECGYDMATTHKSCPGCGALHQRQARFCTDCGHAF